MCPSPCRPRPRRHVTAAARRRCMPSMTPGTPTHSKMTGRFGGAAPTASARATDMPPGSRDAAQLLHGADPEVETLRDGGRGLPARRIADVRATSCAGSTTTSAPHAARVPADGREVAGHHGADTVRLQHADHGETDRPASDDDRDVALADLTLPHRVPRHRHRLGQRGHLRRQPVGHRQVIDSWTTTCSA